MKPLHFAVCAVLMFAPMSIAAEKPHVVFVTGDEEYRSEESMPMIAKILAKEHGFRCTMCYALDKDGTINPSRLDHIDGLDALKDADLMIMFTRWRNLPDEQFQKIQDYANSGRPMIGFRTASHAFKFNGGPNAKWNDAFSQNIFGQKWITHHGHEKGEFLTDVTIVDAQKKNPILRGVEPFKVPSWLYHVQGGGDELTGDCVPLLDGKSLVSGHERAKKTDRYPLVQPVAWTKSFTGTSGKKSKVFFTTLGHPSDFKAESMRKLVVNAVYWTLNMEEKIPEKGTKVDFVVPYEPTNASAGGHRKSQKPQPIE